MLPLLLGQGGDELAAEVRDVCDHAAPDRVGSGLDTLEQAFARPPGAPRRLHTPDWCAHRCGPRGGRPRYRWAPLSRPNPCRSTPITITVLRFSIYLNAEGVRDVQIIG